MSKYEILSQTGISALAQANSMEQEVPSCCSNRCNSAVIERQAPYRKGVARAPLPVLEGIHRYEFPPIPASSLWPNGCIPSVGGTQWVQ